MGGPALIFNDSSKTCVCYIKHVNNVSPNANFTGISEKYSIRILFMLSMTECVWEFQNNALWDTHQHTLIN